MKFKKAAALTMAAAMTLGVTGGMPVSADDDIYEVVVQFPTLGTTPSDLQKVEDAINERTESEIGVHVTFYPVSAFETNNTTSLMVSSGEKLDLAISIFEGGVANYVNKGMLLELDDLVDQYGQDIVEAEGVAMKGGYFDGALYGIPTEEKMGRVKAFECRKDLLDKYGIEYDENKIYTLEDLSEIFATVQAGEGDALVIAGMGGPLMERILTEGKQVLDSFQELILQPQSDVCHFRHFIREQGWEIREEELILEDGKFYPMMRVTRSIEGCVPWTKEEEAFGKFLLEARHPVLKLYLQRELGIRKKILEKLVDAGEGARERKAEVEEEKQLLMAALTRYESK